MQWTPTGHLPTSSPITVQQLRDHLDDSTVLVEYVIDGVEVQAIKAGVLEIADLLVVNKADLPLAERTARQLAAFSGQVPVLRTVALRGTGVVELADAIAASPRRAGTAPEARTARLIEQMALERVRRGLDRAALAKLSQAVLRGELGFDAAAARLLAPPD